MEFNISKDILLRTTINHMNGNDSQGYPTVCIVHQTSGQFCIDMVCFSFANTGTLSS